MICSPDSHTPDFDPVINHNGPSLDPRGFASFVEHSRREFPQLVRQALERIVNEEVHPLEESLKSGKLIEIIKDCQEQTFVSYRLQFDAMYRDLESNVSREQPTDTQNSLQHSQDNNGVRQEQGPILEWGSLQFTNTNLECKAQQNYDDPYIVPNMFYEQATLKIQSEQASYIWNPSCTSSRPYSCNSGPTPSLAEGPPDITTTILKGRPCSAEVGFLGSKISAHDVNPGCSSGSLFSKNQDFDWNGLVDMGDLLETNESMA